MEEISVKKIIEEKVAKVVNDQTKVYDQTHELIIQVFSACMVRDVVREYRFQREYKTKSYNIINSFSHTALENYAIIQLWKLFDEKNSVLNAKHVVECLPHPDIKLWFNAEYAKIKTDVDRLSAWRGGLVAHRSEIGHFAPEEFEKKFKDLRGSEDGIKSFLLHFLCEIKFEMQQTERHKTMEQLSVELRKFAGFLNREKEKVLKEF